MRQKPFGSLVAAATVASTSLAFAGALTVSVDFGGRSAASGNPSTPPLNATDVAGVVAVPHWNLVDDQYAVAGNGVPVTLVTANDGVAGPLADSTGSTSAGVTITFNANDSWYNDVDITGGGTTTNAFTDPNALMMNGIIKDSTGLVGFYKFGNLPEGAYDLYVYLNDNGDGVGVNLWDWDGISTNYVIESHTFTNNQPFVAASNTDPTATRPVGNYVHLTGMQTYGRGAVGFYSEKAGSNGDGMGIAGLQIVQTGAAGVNTRLPQVFNTGGHHRLVTGSTYTMSVQTLGLVNGAATGWYKNGQPISGATGLSYTVTVDSSFNATAFTYVAANNVGSVTSAPVVITAGNSIKLPGLVRDQIWYNHTSGDLRGSLETGGLDSVPADVDSNISSVAGPTNDGINNYVQRISGLFKAPSTGAYVFFICSDDNSDFFLSTDSTPANKHVIATEPNWSNALLWNTDSSGADITQKRSDQNANTAWPTGNTINLVGGNYYYFEADMEQGGGGDNLGATYKLATDNDPNDGDASTLTGSVVYLQVVDGATVNFTATPPSSVTAQANTKASFTLAGASSIIGDDATGPNISIQWQAKAPGTGAFTNVPGGASGSFGTPASSTLTTRFLTVADNGTVYQALVTANDFSTTIGPITLTVTPDKTPPTVVSVGALNALQTSPSNALPTDPTGIQVGIILNKPLTTGTSLNLANFALSSGTVTAAKYDPNPSGYDTLNSGIVLTTTGLTKGQTYTLTVNGLVDFLGNVQTTPVTTSFTVSKMTWVALGTSYDDPNFVPEAYSVGTNGFNLVSGGNGYWGTEDDVTFVYEAITGDFDKVAQVEYVDPASNWARAGLRVSESLQSLNDAASRYQNIHVDPTIKFDGTSGNNQWETNLRFSTGAATTSAQSSGDYPGAESHPSYPNVWVRLQRQGDVVNMYFSHDGVTWRPVGSTDFNPADGTGSPLPATMYVGPVYCPENNNISSDPTTDGTLRNLFAIRVRGYSDFTPNKPEGKQTYGIGVQFTDTQMGGPLGPQDVAGVDAVAQSHWNAVLPPIDASTAPLTLNADQGGQGVTTSAAVDWSGSPNTWSTTGRGEENNGMSGSDALLMTGYLDSGGATTTDVHFAGLPSALTSHGYDVVVYAQNSVPGRGGGYRLLSGNIGSELRPYVLAQSGTLLSNWVQVPTSDNEASATYGVGNYIVFTNVTASEITVEASTGTSADTGNSLALGGTPRASIAAVQLVSPSGLLTAAPPVKPTISIASDNSGNTIITFVGVLQSAATPGGAYSAVTGATSPYKVPSGGASVLFYRASSN